MADDGLIIPSPLPTGQLFDRLDFKSAPTGMTIAANMFSSWERSKDKKEIIPLTALPHLTIGTLWKEFFANDHQLLLDYHTERKERDMLCSKWELHPDRASGYRVLTLMTVVEVPRPNTYTPLHEAHRFAFSMETGKPKLTYTISSQTPNVPLGTTFRCETLIEITAESLDSPCSLTMFANAKKMSMGYTAIQMIAAPRAIRELQSANILLLNMLTAKLCGQPLQIKPTLSPPPIDIQPIPVTPIATGIETHPVGGQPSAESHSRSEALPSWSLYVLIVLAVVAVLLMIWALSSVSSANRNLEEIVRSTRSLLPWRHGATGGGGGTNAPFGAASMWDIVDRDLLAVTSPSSSDSSLKAGVGDADSSKLNSASADDNHTLNRAQLEILSKQSALFDRAMSVLSEIQQRQDSLERHQSWLLSLCLSQLLVVIIVVVKVFFV